MAHIFVSNQVGMKASVLVVFLFAMSGLFAQVSAPVLLELINGQVVEVYAFNDSSFTNLQYQFDKHYFKRERLNNKVRRDSGDYFNTALISLKGAALPFELRSGAADRSDVFAARYPDGTVKQFYTYDEAMGNVLTQEEMHSFVVGSRDARVAITGKKWFYAGLGVGALASYATQQSVFALAIPPVFALTAKIPTIKIPKQAISEPVYLGDMDYAAGFEHAARSRNLREALKGSALGTLLGLVAYTLIDNNF